MLIHFSVENFRSIRDSLSLTMSPAPKWKTHNEHIIDSPENKGIKLLPVAAIYGANASGKSNLVKAMYFMKEFILGDRKPDATIEVVPFLLEGAKWEAELPVKLEVMFKTEGVVYTYGFVVDRKIVREEWLFAYYSNRESKVFERTTNLQGEANLEIGGRLLEDESKNKKYLEFIAKGTRANRLFLSEAYTRNVDTVVPVWKWFAEKLNIIMPTSYFSQLETLMLKNPGFAAFISQSMSKLDLGLDGVTWHEEEFTQKNSFGIPPAIAEKIIHELSSSHDTSQMFVGESIGQRLPIMKDHDGTIKSVTIQTRHHRNDGSPIELDLTAASDGTKRLLDLVPILQAMVGQDKVFVIDELDRSLHTLLSRRLIESLLDLIVKKESLSQMIFTTHDTNLLDRDLLRSDEIWIIEKNPATQGSEISSLSDFKISDGLNLENGYITGRFGGIPFFSDARKLP